MTSPFAALSGRARFVRLAGRTAACGILAASVTIGVSSGAQARTVTLGTSETVVLDAHGAEVKSLPKRSYGPLSWADDGSAAITWVRGGRTWTAVRPAGGRFSRPHAVRAGDVPGAQVQDPWVGPGGTTLFLTEVVPGGSQWSDPTATTVTIGQPDGRLSPPQSLGLTADGEVILAARLGGAASLVAIHDGGGLSMRGSTMDGTLSPPQLLAGRDQVYFGIEHREAIDPDTGAALFAWRTSLPCASDPARRCDVIMATLRPSGRQAFGPVTQLDAAATWTDGKLQRHGYLGDLAVTRVADRFVLGWSHLDEHTGIDTLRVATTEDGRIGTAQSIPNTGRMVPAAGCTTTGSKFPVSGPERPGIVLSTLAGPKSVRLVLARMVDACTSQLYETVVAPDATASVPIASALGVVRGTSRLPKGVYLIRDAVDGEVMIDSKSGSRLFRSHGGGPFQAPGANAYRNSTLAAITPVGQDDVALLSIHCGLRGLGFSRVDALVLRRGRVVRRAQVVACGPRQGMFVAEGGRIVTYRNTARGLFAAVSCPVTARTETGMTKCRSPRRTAHRAKRQLARMAETVPRGQSVAPRSLRP